MGLDKRACVYARAGLDIGGLQPHISAFCFSVMLAAAV